jgi:hypothetical protein
MLRDGKGFTNAITLASATTTDIGGQNALSVEISGTTTITSFGTSYNGPRFIRFAGALTLTHSSTILILPTAANITTAAGDTAIAIPTQAGTGWAVISYTRASGAALSATDYLNTTRIDVASASTVDLTANAPNTRHIRITGTTAITAFTIAAGLCYFVTFSGATTLTNGAGLVTQTGANILTAAGDTCIIRATAANTVEVLSYVPAANPAVLRSYLSGLTLSTAGSSGTMSIAAGQAADSTNAVLINVAAISKTTSSWAVGSAAGGLDTGSIATSTWYYFYAIRRPDTGVTDVVFSTSSTSPTLPTNYTQYRYIGAGLTNGSSQWVKFTQFGDEFTWDTPVLDFNTTGSTTSALLTCSVPRGRKMKAWLNLYLNQDTNQVYLSDPANSDLAPSLTAAPLGSLGFTSASFAGTVQAACWTNASAQIRHREANGTGTLRVATIGWTDLRGKDL